MSKAVGNSLQTWPCTLAAWTAATAGLLMVVAGTGHLVGVLAVASADDKALDFRRVSLIATGGILVYPGLLNMSVAWWIGRRKQWAFAMSASGTAALLSYLALLLFMESPPDSEDPFAGAGSSTIYSMMINGIYLALLFVVWIAVLRRGTRRDCSDGGGHAAGE